MTQNLPDIRRKLPEPTPKLTRSMQPQELSAHRERIGFEVKTILSFYYQADEHDAIETAKLAFWMDALQDWKIDTVRHALRKWNEQNPNKRPSPGHILAILKEAWGKRHAEEVARSLAPVAPDRPVVTEEQRKERQKLVAELVPGLKRMKGDDDE